MPYFKSLIFIIKLFENKIKLILLILQLLREYTIIT